MEYKAPLDFIGKLTIAVWIFLLFMLGFKAGIILLAPNINLANLLKEMIIFMGVLVALGIFYSLMPRKYILENEALLIRRTFGNIVLRYSDIEKVSKLPDDKTLTTLLNIEDAGVFANLGICYNAGMGYYNSYSTQV